MPDKKYIPCKKRELVNGRLRIIYKIAGSQTKYIISKGKPVKLSTIKGGLTPITVIFTPNRPSAPRPPLPRPSSPRPPSPTILSRPSTPLQ
jgi:hypothetical protein